jgi:hypothetical protein
MLEAINILILNKTTKIILPKYSTSVASVKLNNLWWSQFQKIDSYLANDADNLKKGVIHTMYIHHRQYPKKYIDSN